MIRRFLGTALLSVTAASLSAKIQVDSRDLIDRVESRMSFYHEYMPDLSVDNPSMQIFSYDSSLSGVTAGWLNDSGNRPVVTQEGNGLTQFVISADSYMRLDGHSVVWGDVSFTSADRRDMKWNNCVDYERLRPFVLGDSVGGDLTSRRYAFAGGYAVTFGKWSLGATARYRASIDYRNRDPRLKILVSDLNVAAGVSYMFGERYALGFSAGLEVYNQESDLQFYNPLNDIVTYALTGLGTCYDRFSGNSSENSAYCYVGLDCGLQLRDLSDKGLVFKTSYGHYRVDQILRDFNNLTLGQVGSHELNATLGYSFAVERFKTGISVDGKWNRRIATENLFGTSVGNNFVKISSRQMYYSDRVIVSLGVPMEWRIGRRSSVRMKPSAVYEYDMEHYRRPRRELSLGGWTPGMRFGYNGRCSDRLLLDMSASVSRSIRNVRSRELTGLDPDSSLGKMVAGDFDTASSDMTAAVIRVDADYFVSENMDLTIGLEYGNRRYDNGVNRHHIGLKIGLKF